MHGAPWFSRLWPAAVRACRREPNWPAALLLWGLMFAAWQISLRL